ncbi:MAG: type II toxin-antitoxin system RelE/ParE family toxin [Dehalococcoidia bacterium]
MRVEWTDEAQADLDNIAEFHANDPARARAIIDSVVRRMEQLALFPRSAGLIPGANPAHIRQLVEGQYRVLYAAGPETIMVLGVPHASRLL